MLKRTARVLIGFIVALGLTIPASVRAMPMPGATMDMAQATKVPCQECPQPHQTNTTPDKMPTCQTFGCISAAAVLPSPVLLAGRVLLGTAYISPEATRFAGAEPDPDPFPPRPIVLL